MFQKFTKIIDYYFHTDYPSLIYIREYKGSLFFIFYFFSGAINQVTKNLALEWAKDNIRTNTVAPWLKQNSYDGCCTRKYAIHFPKKKKKMYIYIY